MSESMFSKRKAEIKAEFAVADKEQTLIVNRLRDLNQQLAAVKEKIIRLDAAYVELLRFEPDPTPAKPEEVKVPETETTH